MFRPLFAGLLAAGLLAAAGSPDSTAQQKKEPPRKVDRIAVDDPEKAKADPDFLIQGEYEGVVKVEGKVLKVASQVIARGAGQFEVKNYAGGLPGAGWDGKNPETSAATREGTKAVVRTRLRDAKVVGEIADGVMTVDGYGKGTLKKVERKSPTLGAKPPAGAVVLFGKPGDEANWAGGKLVELPDGKFLGVGGTTKRLVGAVKMHVEFRLPWMPTSTGQSRGNSGVYLQRRYECQVLDSFGLAGANNECGSVYTQTRPLVNMCYPPLAWQTYDLDFTPAAFDAAGQKVKNARVTLVHNGVTVQDGTEVKGPTGHGQPEKPTPGPIAFQNHRCPVVYNNVWLVEAK